MRILTDIEGLRVRLTGERLSHIREHPEMQGFEVRIAETVRRPDRVLESLSDPATRLYYRFYMDTRVGNKHLCVVVRVAENDAFVLTAYLTARRSRGRQLWPRES